MNESLFPHLLRGRNYITDSVAPGSGGAAAGRCSSRRCAPGLREHRTWSTSTTPMPGIAGGSNGCARNGSLKVGGPKTR